MCYIGSLYFILFCSMKVFGDRSIKYKYLNPNTLVLALGTSVTYSPDKKAAAPPPAITSRPSSRSSRDDGQEEEEGEELPPSITTMIVDTVGRCEEGWGNSYYRAPSPKV